MADCMHISQEPVRKWAGGVIGGMAGSLERRQKVDLRSEASTLSSCHFSPFCRTNYVAYFCYPFVLWQKRGSQQDTIFKTKSMFLSRTTTRSSHFILFSLLYEDEAEAEDVDVDEDEEFELWRV